MRVRYSCDDMLITYAMQIVMAFLMMTAMSIMVPRAGVTADRIDEVLKTEAFCSGCEEARKRLRSIKVF